MGTTKETTDPGRKDVVDQPPPNKPKDIGNLKEGAPEEVKKDVPVPVPEESILKKPPPKSADKRKNQDSFSDILVKNFRPFHVLMAMFGRTPLTRDKRGPGVYIYNHTGKSFSHVYFLFTTILFFAILLIGTFNAFVILLDVRFTSTSTATETITRNYERILIERHLCTFIIIWTALIHCCIVSVSILLKKEYMANFFSFWARAVDTMYMDPCRNLHKYASFVVLAFMLSMMTFPLLTILHKVLKLELAPSSVGGPTIMTMLMIRGFKRSTWLTHPDHGFTRTLFQGIGGGFILFIIISSKIYILVFLFKCKILGNAFANWNGRVYAAVLRGGDFLQNDRGRTTYSLLFKDHCILLDLMEGTDRLFSTIIESYFGLQVVSVCIQLYFFIRTAKYGSQQAADPSNYFIRPYDWIPGLILFTVSMVILVSVSKAAAEVGEEALAGLEVIRRKTLLGRRTDTELYFMLSMFSSYTAHRKLELSGGGYFYLNKEFLVGIVSTIFSYFIILYQFQPTLDAKVNASVITREDMGRFLVQLENLRDKHWVASTTEST